MIECPTCGNVPTDYHPDNPLVCPFCEGTYPTDKYEEPSFPEPVSPIYKFLETVNFERYTIYGMAYVLTHPKDFLGENPKDGIGIVMDDVLTEISHADKPMIREILEPAGVSYEMHMSALLELKKLVESYQKTGKIE